METIILYPSTHRDLTESFHSVGREKRGEEVAMVRGEREARSAREKIERGERRSREAMDRVEKLQY